MSGAKCSVCRSEMYLVGELGNGYYECGIGSLTRAELKEKLQKLKLHEKYLYEQIKELQPEVKATKKHLDRKVKV